MHRTRTWRKDLRGSGNNHRHECAPSAFYGAANLNNNKIVIGPDNLGFNIHPISTQSRRCISPFPCFLEELDSKEPPSNRWSKERSSIMLLVGPWLYSNNPDIAAHFFFCYRWAFTHQTEWKGASDPTQILVRGREEPSFRGGWCCWSFRPQALSLRFFITYDRRRKLACCHTSTKGT